MKTTFAAALLITSLCTLPAWAAESVSAADTKAIEALIKQREQAWKAHDVDKLIAMAADDIDTVSSKGVHTVGKEALRKQYEKAIKDHKVQLKSEGKISSIRKLGETVYLVNSSSRIKSNEGNGSEYDIFVTHVLLKRGADFKISAIRSVRLAD